MRSLRWRLVLAMALIIAASVAAAGLFSSITVKREFSRFLVAQRLGEIDAAVSIIRAAGPAGLEQALRRVHGEIGLRTIVADGGRVVARYPPEMREYAVTLEPNGIRLLRRRRGAVTESLRLRGNVRSIGGVGSVYFVPPARDARRVGDAFRLNVDRWLVGGLGGAALLAVLVMLTILRRVLAPVEALTRGARALAKGRLEARVNVKGRDEIAELAGAFNSMAESLERNERARRNMLGDVAHELRTPLTNIRVQVEAVEDGVVAADGRLLESIREEVVTLARLVDDLQQLSLAEAGQLRLEICDVAVDEIVERALDGMQRRADHVTIARAIAPDLVVRADGRRVVQALRNLLVNALTHARAAVEVRAAPTDGRVEIRVSDDGPGVPGEHVDRIFDRFYRADPSRSRDSGGAGLGLAIARELVELQGGSIRYERPAFVITLPGGGTAPAAAGPPGGPSPASS